LWRIGVRSLRWSVHCSQGAVDESVIQYYFLLFIPLKGISTRG